MELFTRSWRIRGIDGNDISISETVERTEVVIAIQQNDDLGKIATVRLNAQQLETFFGLRYGGPIVAATPSPTPLEAVAAAEEA